MSESKTKLCRICSEEIPVENKSRVYCDRDHYRNCLECKKDFLVKKVVNPPLFCSVSCSAKNISDQKSSKSKKCKLCGEEFLYTNPNSKFCSDIHYKRCLNCKKTFEIKNPSKVKEYCSHSCSVSGKIYHKTCKKCNEAFTTTDPRRVYCKGPHFQKCEFCSKSFEVKNPKKSVRFCSTSCSSRSSSFGKKCAICDTSFSSNSVSAKFCEKDHLKKCTSCGNEFAINKYNLSSKTCSHICASKITDFEERNRKSVETLRSRYGVENSYFLPHVIESMRNSERNRISLINSSWKSKMESLFGIELEFEKEFGKSSFADLGYRNVLIDINPTISHNSTIAFIHSIGKCIEENCEKHFPRSPSYHHERAITAEREGKQLLQFFDWFDEDVFNSVVRSKLLLDENKVYGRNCEVREISQRDANVFLKENHLLGATKRQTFCVGLFYDGELVHVNTYGPARLNKSFEWEAIRSCSKMNWHIQGGIQKCDKFFQNSKSPKSIISYIDMAISTGDTESKNPGWNLTSVNKASSTWVYLGSDKNLDGRPRFIKGNSARMISADRLLGLTIGEKYPEFHKDGSKFTNDDVLKAEGYVQVWDAGTKTFTWRSNTNESYL